MVEFKSTILLFGFYLFSLFLCFLFCFALDEPSFFMVPFYFFLVGLLTIIIFVILGYTLEFIESSLFCLSLSSNDIYSCMYKNPKTVHIYFSSLSLHAIFVTYLMYKCNIITFYLNCSLFLKMTIFFKNLYIYPCVKFSLCSSFFCIDPGFHQV